jgi:aldose 1-epimerase
MRSCGQGIRGFARTIIFCKRLQTRLELIKICCKLAAEVGGEGGIILVETQAFGTIHGQAVTAYTLTNQHGVRLTCLDYGATWLKLEVPTAVGRQNLLLTSPSFDGYADPRSYHGKTIGRVAGRIGADQYPQPLPANEGTSTLHGGPHGFSTLMWAVQATAEQLVFSRYITSAEDGFPGDIDVKVTYTLTANDDVLIDFDANTDQPTLFNPTNHAYWNLNAGDETIQNHQLMLNSHQRFAVQTNKVPTGELLDNAHGGFDFSHPTDLGAALATMQTTAEKGYDDIFLVAPHAASEPVAKLTQGKLGVTMYSRRNALVVFTANAFGDELDFGEKTSRPYIGIALEAQTAPSAVADPRYGDIQLLPEHPRHEQVRYHFEY